MPTPGNSVTKIAPNGTMTTYTGTGFAPTRIAFDGTNMWTINSMDNSFSKITPSGVISTFPISTFIPNPVGIAFDGDYMWTVSGSSYAAARISTSCLVKTPPPACAAVTTTSGACSYPISPLANGTSATIDTTTGGYVGAITASCVDGVLSYSGINCQQICTTPMPVTYDDPGTRKVTMTVTWAGRKPGEFSSETAHTYIMNIFNN
jgi:hypothetical protein